MKIATEWLKAAYADIITLENIWENEYVTHITAFHAQQTVEKSLKALLEHYNHKVPKQHDLLKLHSAVSDVFPLVDTQLDLLDTLNELYIDSRYPGDMGLLPYGKPILEDAKEFYEFACGVFDEVCRLLGLNKETLLK